MIYFFLFTQTSYVQMIESQTFIRFTGVGIVEAQWGEFRVNWRGDSRGWRGVVFKVWCNDRLAMLFETTLALCKVISHFWVASADTRVDFNVRSILQARSHLPFSLRCRPSRANASCLFHSPAPAGCRTSDPSSACWRLPSASGRPVWCPAWAPRWFPLRDRK